MNNESSPSATPWQQIRQVFDLFWMSPADLRMLDVMRRFYGELVIVCSAILWLDHRTFFGAGSLLPADAARGVVDPDVFTVYSFLPDHPLSVALFLLLSMICGGLLIAGIYPRITAGITLFLLTGVHHSNMMLFDAEDTVFRLFAFFFIFAPPWRELKEAPTTLSPERPHAGFPAWPIRLFQLQFCLIYLCAGIQKSNGAEWIDGTAVYYTLRLDDMTGCHLPGFIAESLAWSKFFTWGTLAFELLVPFLIWNRWLRWPCIVLAMLFHLGMEYAFNLHLFHPIMLVGLLSFVRYDELQRAWKFVVMKVTKRTDLAEVAA
ncbi:MAG: HTTM domain-containing protein [Planctomycetaceae bacterium]